MVDENGNILADQLLNIKQIEIDEIELDYLFYKLELQIHKFVIQPIALGYAQITTQLLGLMLVPVAQLGRDLSDAIVAVDFEA